MRKRFWLFAALIAAALAANLALVSRRFAQSTEEGLGSRLTVASGGVRTQLELVDLRTSPRLAAFSPELIEATRPPNDSAQQPGRPDERALRAAANALQPEPDLLVVATAHAAAVSRRGKAASLSEDPSRLPLIRIALDGGASPQFVTFDGKLYRASAARIPGNASVVLTGTLVDDRFAAQLRTLVDADVSFLQQGAVVASSLSADDRAALAAWAKAPGSAGFGAIRVVLPAVGTRFSDQLPLGAPRTATRAALLPLAQGVQVAVSVPAAPQLLWLAHYQAFSAAALAAFVLVAFIWGLFMRQSPRAQVVSRTAAAPARSRDEAKARRSAELIGADVSTPAESARDAPEASDAPWSDEPVSAPRRASRGHEPLDPELAPLPARDEDPQLGPLQTPAGSDPVWSGDTFSPAGANRDLAAAEGEPEPPSALGAGWGEASTDGASTPAPWDTGEPAPETAAAEPWPPPEPTPLPMPAAKPAKPAPKSSAPVQKDVTLNDFALPAADSDDPDEAHFRETFDQFMAMRAETGESGTLSYDKFAAKLRQNREQLLSRGTAKSVRFTVYKKDGRAAIKASAIRN